MQWKKVLSGVLTCAMVFTSAAPGMPVLAAAKTAGGGYSGNSLNVTSLGYQVPAEGEYASSVKAGVSGGHYEEIKDRSAAPVELDANFKSNVVKGKPVYASGDKGTGYEASKAVDDDLGTSWIGSDMGSAAQWLMIDLQAQSVEYASMQVAFGGKAWATKYKVETSADGQAWESVASVDRAPSNSGESVRDTFRPEAADGDSGLSAVAAGALKRFVRFSFERKNPYAVQEHAVSVQEISIIGLTSGTVTDTAATGVSINPNSLSLSMPGESDFSGTENEHIETGKSVYASGENAGTAYNAIDGNKGTYWRSDEMWGAENTFSQWVMLDLEAASTKVSEIKLHYEAKAWPTEYTVETSASGADGSWETVGSLTKPETEFYSGINDTFVSTSNVNENNNSVARKSLDKTILKRFVRFHFTKLNQKAGGIRRVSLYEVEIKGIQAEDQTGKLTAAVTSDDAAPKAVEWSSNDVNIAMVDQDGNVTARSNGSALITAKVIGTDNVSATANVTVGSGASASEASRQDAADGAQPASEQGAAMAAADAPAKIAELDGVWGFNDQLEGKADKFKVWGDSQMVIAFKLYLRQLPSSAEDARAIVAKGSRYGVRLTNNGLELYYLNESGTTVTVPYANCFTAGSLNAWHDVVAVVSMKGAGPGSRIYVDGQASPMVQGRDMMDQAVDYPFSLGCEVIDGAADKMLTANHGYLADVRFYNSREMSEGDQNLFVRRMNLQTLDGKQDKGWSDINRLMEVVEPTANFTLNPYTAATVWADAEGNALTEEETFRCGTEYTATTTLTAKEGFTFQAANVGDLTAAAGSYRLEKLSLAGCGSADSEKTEHETDGPASWAVDGDESTHWHSDYGTTQGPVVNLNTTPKQNNTYTITLPAKKAIGKFVYVPRQDHDPDPNGNIYECNLLYSEESGENAQFKPIVNGIVRDGNKDRKIVTFDPVEAKAIKIEVQRAKGNVISAAEFYLYEAVPEKPVIESAQLSENNTVMTIKAKYSADQVSCGKELESASFGQSISLEAGGEYQIQPRLLASDGRPAEEHPGLSVEGVTYSYEAKAEDGEADTNLITVSNTGKVTARDAAGKAIVKASVQISGKEPVTKNIPVEVFAKGSMLLYPDLSYAYPAAGEYPRIATAKLQRTDLTPVINVVTNKGEGEAELQQVAGAADTVSVLKDGIMGFNGRYKAIASDQQFNVTDNNPMVVTLRFWLENLPETVAGRSYMLFSRGDQYKLYVSNLDGNPTLKFEVKSNNTWHDWKYPITASDEGKWHDIVVVADGKGTTDSVGFYVDGKRAPKSGEAAAVSITSSDKRFAVCDQDGSTTAYLTEEVGYLSGLRFYNINRIDPTGVLAGKVDVQKLGAEHADAAIQSLVDVVEPTAYISVTPYTMSTAWSALDADGKETALSGDSKFTLENIAKNGYVATTTFETVGDFRFGFDETELDNIDFIHVSPEVSASLVSQTADVTEDGKKLTIKVTFKKAGIPALSYLTYVSPGADRTVRRSPRYDEEAAKPYFTQETQWLKNGTGEALGNDYAFEAITETNWYQAKTTLTAKDGHVFDGSEAYINEVKENVNPQLYGNVAADKAIVVAPDGKSMTITVDYKTPIYRVTFDTSGGTPAEVNGERDQSVSEGNLAGQPEDPTRENFKFLGWYTAAGEEYDFSDPVNANVTLKAKWVEGKTITFDTRLTDASGNRIQKKLSFETNEPVTSVDPTQLDGIKGKEITFLGWFTDEAYTEEFDGFGQPINENITLYAKWEATVTLKDGETVLKEMKVNPPTTVKLNDPDKKEGYKFKGWFKEGSGDPEDEFISGSSIVSESLTLTAKWAKLYKVTFDFGITGMDSSVVEVEEGQTVAKPDTPTNGDQIFKGWFEEGSDVKFDFSKPISEDCTIQARWMGKDDVWTVTFMDGEEKISDVLVEKGQKMDQSDLPALDPKDHYRFDGWYTDAECTEKFDVSTANIEANMTLYAKWSPIKVMKITLDQTKLSMKEGEEVKLNATVEPKDALDTTCLWESNDETVATVDDKGLVKAVKAGDAKITVTAKDGSGIKAVASVTVTGDIKPGDAEISLNKTALTMFVNETETLTATVSEGDSSSVTWSSDAEAVASVKDGVVTAKSVGTATITATAANGKTATAKVTVAEPVNLSVGKSATASAYEKDTQKALDGKSENNSYWRTDKIAPFEGGSSEQWITIDLEEEQTRLQSIEMTYQAKGWPTKFKIQTSASGGADAVWKDIVVVEREPEDRGDQVDLFTKENFLLGQADRYVRVFITEGNRFAAALQSVAIQEITIMGAPIEDSGSEDPSDEADVSIKDKQDFSLKVGETKQLEAEVSPADPDAEFEWSSSADSIASVSATGLVTAAAAGEATIKVKVKGKDAEDSVKVTVTGSSEPDKNEFTVSFNGNGEGVTNVPSAQTVKENEKVSKPADPSRAGYRFLGWFKEAAGTTAYNFNDPVTKSFTLYAKWEATGGSDEEEKKDQAKKDRTDALSAAEKIDMATGAQKYTKETWDAFQAAYDALHSLTDAQIDGMTADALSELVKALTDAQAALKEAGDATTPEKEQAEKDADQVLADASKINQATDASKYTSETWQAFVNAYNALHSLTPEQRKNMSAADLKKLVDALKTAQANLKPVTYVTSVKMMLKTYEIVKGKSLNLAKEIASKAPADATNGALTWESANTKIATVNPATGVVKVSKNKKYVKKSTKISVKNAAGAVVATVTVKVMNGNVTKVAAKGKKSLAVKAGGSVTLKASVKTKGKKPLNKKLRWTTSDTKIATVTAKTATSMKVKIAKGVKKGRKVKITATSMDGTNKKVVFTIRIK